MVPMERVVLQFFILIFTINGLHSYSQHPSLGILNELIGQDSNTPLIVVIDSNNQAKTLDDERDSGQEQRKGRHVHNPGHHAAKFSERDFGNALYELLRTSEIMPEKQQTHSSLDAAVNSVMKSKAVQTLEQTLEEKVKMKVKEALRESQIKELIEKIKEEIQI